LTISDNHTIIVIFFIRFVKIMMPFANHGGEASVYVVRPTHLTTYLLSCYCFFLNIFYLIMINNLYLNLIKMN